jgi:protein sidekick
LEPLISWHEYEIQVAAWNNRGLGIFSPPFVAATLEGLPLQAPQNVHVKVLSSTAISVSFDAPNQQMVPGVNLGYKVS